jgi:cell fate regulator YaaT (PSP1 superfamily)
MTDEQHTAPKIAPADTSKPKGKVMVVGVRFYDGGFVYDFAPGSEQYAVGDHVVVETEKGSELGEIIYKREIGIDEIEGELKTVKRSAKPRDFELKRQFADKEAEVFRVCAEKVAQHKLEMKLIGSHYNFDGKRLTFFFTAEGRIDFRDLVRDLASTFNTRIELRQVGPKDAAKMLDGFGVCGQRICCRSFLLKPRTISTKMAGTQELVTRTPEKISGLCGRLMCCLSYEHDTYEEYRKGFPKRGGRVRTKEGEGRVLELKILKRSVIVELDNEDHMRIECPVDEVKKLE